MIRYILIDNVSLDTHSGIVTLPFSFLHPFSRGGGGLLLKENTCFQRKQVLSFKNRPRPQFGMAKFCSEANRNSQKLSPFVKMANPKKWRGIKKSY